MEIFLGESFFIEWLKFEEECILSLTLTIQILKAKNSTL